jgi:hypothetical protein
MLIRRGESGLLIPSPGIQVARVAPATLEETYTEKVARLFGSYYVAHYPLGETSGTTADNAEGTAALDGTFARNVSTMGTGSGIGDGLTAPLFDGTQDVVNFYSSELNTAWDQSDCAVMIWTKVLNSGIWTDSARRTHFILQTDDSGSIQNQKRELDNTVESKFQGGGTTNFVQQTSQTDTDWVCWLLLVDEDTDSQDVYKDGVEVHDGIFNGTWSGDLQSNRAAIGAGGSAGGNWWSGYLAHMVIGVGSGCHAAILAEAVALATV